MRSAGRVLVVDDEEVICNTLRIYLESEDFSVDSVSSGKSALTRLGEQEYDVVLLDILMPQMNGLEVMHWIREEKLPVEVIVTTGAGSHDVAVEAMRLGAFDLLRKPILNLDEKLLPALRQAVDRHRLKAAIQEKEARLKNLDRSLSELYHFSLRIVRAKDDATVIGLLSEATRVLAGGVEFLLLRKDGDRSFRAIGRPDLEPISLGEPPQLPFPADHFAIPLKPVVGAFPIAVRDETIGLFAVGGLKQTSSSEILPLVAILPAVACYLVANPPSRA